MNHTENNNIKIGFSSVKGLSHDKTGTECQDSLGVLFRNAQGVQIITGSTSRFLDDPNQTRPDLVAVISDGLGSKTYSKEAADVVVNTVMAFLCRNHQNLTADNAAEQLQVPLMNAAKNAITEIAQGRPMDCNLAFLLFSGNYAYIGHLGDCAICVLNDTPHARTTAGAIANVTRTVLTADPEDLKVEAFPLDDKLNGFILTTDGLEGELYRKSSGWITKAAEGYFNPIVSTSNLETANSILERKISALRKKDGDIFHDDISIIVVSRTPNDITLENDPTWRCTCGTRNQIHIPYCLTCKQDRLKIYPYDELQRMGQSNLDNFVRYLEKNPQEEQSYLERAAAKLGVAPPKAPVMFPPLPPLKPKPMPRPDPIPVSAPKPVSGSAGRPASGDQYVQPAEDNQQSSQTDEAQEAARRRRAAAKAASNPLSQAYRAKINEETPPQPDPSPLPEKGKWKYRKILLIVAILLASAAALVSLWRLPGSRKPDGVSVWAEDDYLLARLYRDGEAVGEQLRIDHIGVMAPNGEYVYTWTYESEDPTGTTIPDASLPPYETTRPIETSALTEPVEPTIPSASTDPSDPVEYPEGTIFILRQKLKRGRVDPHDPMPAPLDLLAGDKVTSLGDPLEEADNAQWVHIITENGDSGWVDLDYLELAPQP